MLRRACATTVAVIALLAASAVASFPARASEAPQNTDAAASQVLVRFSPGTSGSEIAAAASRARADVAGHIEGIDTHILRVRGGDRSQAIEGLAHNPNVLSVEPDASIDL